MDSSLLANFLDSTDFGASKTTKTVTYKINNTGADTLLLNMPLVSVKGINAADFTVSTLPDSSIAPGDSSSFTISFLSTKIGIKNARVEIVSNDTDEDTFTFAIQASQLLDCNHANALANNLNTTYTAAFSETTPDGWNCYCDSAGSLLLALKLGGTGAVIAPNQVQLQIGQNNTFSSTSTGGLINNLAGYTIIDRRWVVNPTTQPIGEVGVKYFFTKTEFDSIVVKLAAMAAPSIVSNVNQLNIYKATSGALFANPHTVSGIVLRNGFIPSLAIWKDSVVNASTFSAEFKVNAFSGSGGIGFGGGGLALPIELIHAKVNYILVYPNPAQYAFTIVNNNVDEELIYSIYNCAGQKVLHGIFSNQAVVNTQDLNTGVYLIGLSNGQSVKIVIE